MNETPKKVIDGGEKCFLCSESAISSNKIFVFGSDTQHEDATRFSPVQRPHCKASKSIDFAGASNTTNPVVFATSSHEIYQGMQQSLPPSHNPCPLYSFHRPDVCRPIYPFPTASILNRGGSTSINDSVLQLKLSIPIMNSSPVASKTKSTRDVYTTSSSGSVHITVHYPSRTVSKTLDDTYNTLGKALLYGPPSRIATAVMKCAPVRKLVIEKVLNGVQQRLVNTTKIVKNYYYYSIITIQLLLYRLYYKIH